MPYEAYKVLHLTGLILTFLGLGGILLRSRDQGPSRFGLVLHGLGMLALLVAGFGLLARLGLNWPWPGWVWAKLGVWLLVGALPTMHKKGILPLALGWLVAGGAGVAAAWLAVAKPF